MNRDYKLFIEDMLEAIHKLTVYTDGLTYEGFEQSNLIVDAVIRNLEVIGEAANKIPKEVRDKYPEVPWRKMSDFRNILIHEYFGIDLSIVWIVATQNIPETKPHLLKMITDDN